MFSGKLVLGPTTQEPHHPSFICQIPKPGLHLSVLPVSLCQPIPKICRCYLFPSDPHFCHDLPSNSDHHGIQSLQQRFSARSNFMFLPSPRNTHTHQGTFSNVWRHFWLSLLKAGMMLLTFNGQRPRMMLNIITIHRTTHTAKKESKMSVAVRLRNLP